MCDFTMVWVEKAIAGMQVMRGLGYHKHPVFAGCKDGEGRNVDGWQVPTEDVETLQELLAETGAYFFLNTLNT
ncbi:MAG: hypothetical protein A2719_02985 [Candidatus Ryanbacteria bacterium RIFCSPHIGHO2_01_FULL_45_22]|uniref:Uncharacterized protein n=1 Tax=Candidatus Ryanbacteria bacterium RIFCSPHIGHO2_01_FULL_45_22 TaxID=1802114 RepID=A0A1G2G1M9_9BACT|nr:MAG: hypothetical protein A2719_02985 [Candidatus Ryanbacteria bacterium RIFCSPHIGHO2_01_FULL_45_22]